MAKWAKEGHEIHVLIMAEGATSRDKERDKKKCKKKLSQLAKSAKKSSEILSLRSIKLIDYPDNRMDSISLLDVVKSIEEHIEKIKPEIVVTHHFSDLNIDHQITHKAVITACRPQPKSRVKRILSFEVPSATEWQSPSINSPFIPNWFEDISMTLELKIIALEAYKTEMREWPHARSIEALEHLAKWRGSTIGLEAAEAFMLLREIK